MHQTVYLTADAVRDLEEIHEWIQEHDAPGKADHVMEKIRQVVMSLSEFPNRGSSPKEMKDIGIYDFQEIFFKPYRIIYRVIEKKVYVMLISDGRRDMQAFLERRLLET